MRAVAEDPELDGLIARLQAAQKHPPAVDPLRQAPQSQGEIEVPSGCRQVLFRSALVTAAGLALAVLVVVVGKLLGLSTHIVSVSGGIVFPTTSLGLALLWSPSRVDS